jgi:hypothetical protein
MEGFRALFDDNTIKYSPINSSEQKVPKEKKEVPMKPKEKEVPMKPKEKEIPKEIPINTYYIFKKLKENNELTLYCGRYTWRMNVEGLYFHDDCNCMIVSFCHYYVNDHIYYFMNNGHKFTINTLNGKYRVSIDGIHYLECEYKWA